MSEAAPRTSERMNGEEVSDLLVGAIDIHIHTNPHMFPGIHAQDIIQLAQQAHAAGMRALVVKDIGVPTTGAAYVISRTGPGIPIYGAHVMNVAMGGINPRAVWAALNHGDGAKVIHFPTGDTTNHTEFRKAFYAGVNPPLPDDQTISVVRDGKLIPEAREIISLVKEKGAALATAHISAAESHAVIREAKDQGLERIIVSHARWAMTGLSIADLKEFAALGCFIEFEFCLMMPIMYFVHGERPYDPRDLVAAMKEVGTDHCFMSSDLGQLYSPLPIEGMRSYIAILMRCGITADEIRRMFHVNPARIIGLD